MSMIQAEHLTFFYPGSPDPVFEDAAFQIDTRWRLGLIGRNGRGKTTLLRLLMGEYPHEGTLAASESFGYFPSPVPKPERLTAEGLEDLGVPLLFPAQSNQLFPVLPDSVVEALEGER